MRTHFPGALREVRSAARFRLSFAGLWIPDEWRASASVARGACAHGKARMGLQFVTVFGLIRRKANIWTKHSKPQWGRLSPIFRSKTDRKSTRLNSSHLVISYAGFLL